MRPKYLGSVPWRRNARPVSTCPGNSSTPAARSDYFAPMKTFGLLHGANLDRLGKRETKIYGSGTLADLEAGVRAEGKKLGVKMECFQSNHEGALIEQIAKWADAGVAGIILNSGALTHTSVALRD